MVLQYRPDKFLFVPAKDFVKLRGRVENFGKCGCQFKVSSDHSYRIPSIKELFKKIDFGGFISEVFVFVFILPSPDCGSVNVIGILVRKFVSFGQLFGAGMIGVVLFQFR